MDSPLVRRFGAVTAADVGALDTAAADLGVGVLHLMEAAGIQVARLAWRMIGRRPGVVHVVAGRGHNGGDGMVAARHLAGWGCPVIATVHAEPDTLTDLLLVQCRAARGAGVDVRLSAADGTAATMSAVLVVDALLGTGFRGPLRPEVAAILSSIHGQVLSVDIPSGMSADVGAAAGAAVRATATCVLAAVKQGQWTAGAEAHTGRMYVADIGLPHTAWHRCGLTPPSAVRGGGLRAVPTARQDALVAASRIT